MNTLPHESLDDLATGTARDLTDYAAQSAFQLFQNKRFRDLAGFDAISQEEQDRIFNELVCAFVVLVMLILEARDLRIAKEFREYLEQLNRKIPEALINMLENMGVEEEHRSIWQQLIDLRHDEYSRDKHEVRKAAMQLESDENTLNVESLAAIQLLVPVQSVAIGCHHHNLRGETEGKDELFKILLKDLSKFYINIRVRLEGGKITLFTKMRAKVIRWLRK